MNEFLKEVLAYEAKLLLADMLENPMIVVLMPAPEPRHSGHMVRRVISRPPSWYMDRFYRGRGRKTFKRKRFLRALQRVILLEPVLGSYQAEIVEFLMERLEN